MLQISNPLCTVIRARQSEEGEEEEEEEGKRMRETL